MHLRRKSKVNPGKRKVMVFERKEVERLERVRLYPLRGILREAEVCD